LNNDSSIATRTSVLRSLQITGHLHRTISSAISGTVWAETGKARNAIALVRIAVALSPILFHMLQCRTLSSTCV
jgi:hypothetical protein